MKYIIKLWQRERKLAGRGAAGAIAAAGVMLSFIVSLPAGQKQLIDLSLGISISIVALLAIFFTNINDDLKTGAALRVVQKIDAGWWLFLKSLATAISLLPAVLILAIFPITLGASPAILYKNLPILFLTLLTIGFFATIPSASGEKGLLMTIAILPLIMPIIIFAGVALAADSSSASAIQGLCFLIALFFTSIIGCIFLGGFALRQALSDV